MTKRGTGNDAPLVLTLESAEGMSDAELQIIFAEIVVELRRDMEYALPPDFPRKPYEMTRAEMPAAAKAFPDWFAPKELVEAGPPPIIVQEIDPRRR
jgi:hypothetical protein